jgi:hypothetical protein
MFCDRRSGKTGNACVELSGVDSWYVLIIVKSEMHEVVVTVANLHIVAVGGYSDLISHQHCSGLCCVLPEVDQLHNSGCSLP